MMGGVRAGQNPIRFVLEKDNCQKFNGRNVPVNNNLAH